MNIPITKKWTPTSWVFLQLIEASKCNASEFNVDFDILTVTNSSCQKWLYDKSFFKETLVTQVRKYSLCNIR